MTLHLGLLTLALLAPLGAAHAAAGGRLVRADGQGVSFEVTTGSELTALAPRTVWIAVPPGQTVVVTSSVLEASELEGLRGGPALFGFDTAAIPDEFAIGGAPERGLARDAFVSAVSPPGATHARLLGVTGLRGLRVAAIEIRPALEDGDRLRIATRLAVECSFVADPAATNPAAVPPHSSVFAGIERALLLNSDDADAFRPRAHAARKTAAGAGPDGPLLGSIEVRVARTGLHEITGEQLRALGILELNPSPGEFRLYTRPGLPLLAEDAIVPAYERTEVPIRVEDGGDGKFDPEDRILFYGVGPSGWFDDYGVANPDSLEWLQHPYETHNVYTLVRWYPVGDPPLRWATRDVTPNRPGAAPIEHVRTRMHFEVDQLYNPESNEPGRPWNPWTWTRISAQSATPEIPLHLDGVMPGSEARLRTRFWGVRGEPFDSNPFQLEVRLNHLPIASHSWTSPAPQVIDATGTWLVEGDNPLGLLLAPSSTPGTFRSGLLMACDLVFDRRLLAVGDTLAFTAPDLAGDLAYAVAPFSDVTGLKLLDVSDPLRPVLLTGWGVSDVSGGQAVHFHDAEPGARYFVAGPAAVRPTQLASPYVSDLRTGAADYLVISSDALAGEGSRLTAHRRDTAPPFPGATTRVVRVADIFGAYSGGRMDPAAIRNFLYDAVNGGGWSPAPSFVCLLGDATYDYRDLFHLGGTLGRTQVPTFQRNFYAAGSYSSDDWLADLDVGPDSLGLGPVPDLVVGRLPAATIAEADVLVDKVRNYDWRGVSDSYPESEDWRNRLFWLVDDASQRTQPDPLGTTFTVNVEELDRDHVPAWLERRKVNLLEYPLVGGAEKPAAHQATIDELQRGALLWFYVGRANPFKLADENAFVLSDVAGLANQYRRPFFVANTASVGPFDDPVITPLGEAMVKHAGGGSIATYSATQNTFAFANQTLAEALLDALFAPDRLAAGRTIGEATFLAGRRASASANDRMYQLLGDPATRLATAEYDVRLALFDDATGEALPDSLPRGRVLRLEAEVHRTRDSLSYDLAEDFRGDATFRMTDSPPRMPIPPGSFGPADQTYAGNPRDVMTTRLGVNGGRGTARFVLPLAATPGPDARVLAFVEGRAVRASGARNFTIGAAHPDPTDEIGPQVITHLGGVRMPSENYTVFLTDSSGIRTLVDSTIHRVTVAIDDGIPEDMTARVELFPGRYDVAVFSAQFRNLSDGMHTLRIEASDNLAVTDADVAHRTSVEIPLRISAAAATYEERAIPMPNPFSRSAGTTIVFTGLLGGSHDTGKLMIHDVRGRRIRTVEARSNGDTIQLPWDGRDEAGRAMPPGVYPWRAVLSLFGGISKEYGGRLVLLD